MMLSFRHYDVKKEVKKYYTSAALGIGSSRQAPAIESLVRLNKRLLPRNAKPARRMLIKIAQAS
jgi:hypothetical protein